jgi:hypothetical protein
LYLVPNVVDWNIFASKLKPKHLESLKLDVPSKSTSRVGVLARKHVTYDVWSVPASAALASATEGLAAPTAMGVEEVRGLTCLLPQKRKSGKLYIGKPISYEY